MKQTFLLISLAIILSGCQKLIDRYHNHWGTPPSLKTCRVDSIYPVEKGNPVFNAWTAVGVEYNAKGYPVVANYSLLVYELFRFPVYYRYDDKDRLVEILPPVSDTIPDYLIKAPLHVKYVYEGDSPLPVRDTIFTWHYEQVAEVEDLYYDAHGRVNRVVHRHSQHPFPESYETRYAYDANGNKQVTLAADGTTPALIEYSNKPSLYSLHPVWKLIHKDYSKNAIKSNVESFNEKGLPLVVDVEAYSKYIDGSLYNPQFLNVATGPDFTLSNITYACSESMK